MLGNVFQLFRRNVPAEKSKFWLARHPRFRPRNREIVDDKFHDHWIQLSSTLRDFPPGPSMFPAGSTLSTDESESRLDEFISRVG